MEQTVEEAEETTINTGVKRQLKEQLGPRRKIFPFILLKKISNFSTSNFFPAHLLVKSKKGKKNKTKKEKKKLQIFSAKKAKKPVLAKPKYNCRYSNNVEKR